MTTFIGVVHKEKESDFGVSFPDFPGCVTAGKTMQEAMEMAKDALQGHIEVMHEYGDKLPKKALEIEAVRKEAGRDAVFIMVEADLPGKKERVNVMLDTIIIKRIEKSGLNRSKFLNDAAKHEFARLQA